MTAHIIDLSPLQNVEFKVATGLDYIGHASVPFRGTYRLCFLNASLNENGINYRQNGNECGVSDENRNIF